MELTFIDWLRRNLPPNPRLRVGIGDDAAILAWAEGGDMVITTDAVTDQVDFVLAEVEPRLVGHKALGVNLSDLAAMAAQPVAAVVSLILPRRGDGAGRTSFELAVELYRGMLPLAEEHDIIIAGGDTNTWGGPLAISITAIGRTTGRGPWLRSGARAGDVVLVTGRLGGSILGRHLRVQPRVREALLLNERYDIHAAMDISDGLCIDASRLADASGCGVVLDLAAIPVSPDATRLAATTGKAPVEHALGDGEDFELLITTTGDVAEQITGDQPLGVHITKIGTCVAERGLWSIDNAGRLSPLAVLGYQH